MSRLSPETLEAYLANTLSEAKRSEAEHDLSQCPSSRRLLVQLHQQRSEDVSQDRAEAAVSAELLETARAIGRRQGRARQPRWVGPLAAAALVVLAVGVGGWQLDLWDRAGRGVPQAIAPDRGDTLRSQDPADAITGQTPVMADSPEDGALIQGDGVTLSWSVDGHARDTQLTLVDGLGNILWQNAVQGTSWTLDPSRLQSMPPGTFYWFVTVRLQDGTTAETELRSLRRP